MQRFVVFLVMLALALPVAGCSRDVEVERTKLPHIDKKAGE